MVAIFKLCGLVVRLNIKTIGNIGEVGVDFAIYLLLCICLLYTSPSPRDTR